MIECIYGTSDDITMRLLSSCRSIDQLFLMITYQNANVYEEILSLFSFPITGRSFFRFFSIDEKKENKKYFVQQFSLVSLNLVGENRRCKHHAFVYRKDM